MFAVVLRMMPSAVEEVSAQISDLSIIIDSL